MGSRLNPRPEFRPLGALKIERVLVKRFAHCSARRSHRFCVYKMFYKLKNTTWQSTVFDLYISVVRIIRDAAIAAAERLNDNN